MSDKNDKKRRRVYPKAALRMYAFLVGVALATLILWVAGLLLPGFPFKLSGGAAWGIAAGALLGGALIFNFYRRMARRRED
jgi:membrane associated rhomboid family serine protease